ncbi:hypothetical protein BJX63DRAFT_444591 [Aspergillus granulosus]|uniref:Xylanolytic transcriptional activator regulatory domain-containing protein n=1 Tax=Aspergillus granulosus TaxID=176169 RepID=A0ABR4HXT1_9EURO
MERAERNPSCLICRRRKKLEPPISGLVAIMCALAAPFYYARIAIAAGEEEEEDLDPNIQFFNAGRGWVGTALKAVFLAGSIQGTETLMTQILLHDYYLRVGDYAQAFLVSGMVARHFQLLQFSLEYDTDITCRTSKMKASAKETRRRVGWACYLLDALIECGVDQLRFVSATDIQVQLPCSEELFVRNIPVPTETLPQGQVLPFVNKQSFLADSATANLDLRAYYIRAVVIRSKILRYVKHLQREIPWEDTSQFAQLRNELQALEGSIPDHYKMSPENTCLLKMAGRLNLYFGLHILLAQTYNDLYRVGISRLVFPHSATKWIRENAPGEFLHLCHRMCLTKAVAIASWLQDLWRCDKESLIDLPYAVHAQICSSVLVTTLISWRRFAAEPVLPWLSLDDYRSMLQSNIQILGFLKRYFKAELFHESAAQALKQFNRVNGTPSLNPMANALIRSNVAAPASQTAQSGALEYILNPLGTYPMARTQILDPHQTKAIHGEDSPQSDVEPPAPSSTGPVETIEERLIAENTAIMADNNVLGPMRCELLNWEDELQLMMGMGYPTFMDDSSTQWNYDY